MKLVGSFTLIAVKDPEPAESYTLKMDGTVHLDGYNAQQGEALFYVEHKAGSDTGRAPAYYTVRFLTASHEAGELTFGPDGFPLETLGFTYPADKYGYANTLKVEAYSDPQRSRLMAEGSFPIVRDNPVYKARGEVWDKGLVYRNGEFTLLDDKVYMWDYPVAGNSTLRPDLDRAQNPQFEGGVPYKVDDKTHWTLYEEWEVLATKVLFSQFALLGGAVMAGKMNAQGKYGYAKMYSQTGQDGTTDYQKFDASKDAWDNTQKWKPNLCLDFLKGMAFANEGTFTNCSIAQGCTIGGWKISERSMGLPAGENGNLNGMFLYDDMIGFNDTDRQAIVGTFDILGQGYLGRFTDSKTDIARTGFYISVTGGTMYNTAIALGGGCISGLAEKTQVIETVGYVTLQKNVNVVVLNNKNKLVCDTPTMGKYDDGHKLSLKRISGKDNDGLVEIRATYPNFFIIDDGRPTLEFMIDSIGDAMTFYYVDGMVVKIGIQQYTGAWVQFKNPRDW